MQIDDNFLTELGLDTLPPDKKTTFKQHAQEELEMRIGEKMSKGLTVDQLNEFDGIMKTDKDIIKSLILKIKDFQQDDVYQKLLKKRRATEITWEFLAEYLSVKWIQKYRPNYRQIAEETLAEIKQEILSNRDKILTAQ